MRSIGLAVAVLALAVLIVVPAGSEVSADAIHSAYDSLSEDQKEAFDSLKGVVERMGSQCDVPALTVEEAEEVREAFLSDNPELFWFGKEYSLYVQGSTGMASSFRHDGDMTSEEASAMTKELTDAVSSMQITGSSEADVVRSIHDAVAFATRYDKAADECGNAYGALVDGRSKCDGYSYAFNYLCKQNGISSLCILGTAEAESGGGHAWNLVCVDGAWYYVDVTWDDIPCPGCAKYDYFLVGSETVTPTGKFSESRKANTEFGVVPSETALAYDPYAGDDAAFGAWLEYKTIENAGRSMNKYYLDIGDFRLNYDNTAMKTLASFMESGSYEKWGVVVSRGTASETHGMLDPFDCEVRMYLDENPFSLKQLGLEGKFSLTPPPSKSHPGYYADAYSGSEKVSHGSAFTVGNGVYTVGYVEPTFLEQWGLILGACTMIAVFAAMMIYTRVRNGPADYIPDFDGPSTTRRFDRDSECPECGNICEPDEEFCPYCGHMFKKKSR